MSSISVASQTSNILLIRHGQTDWNAEGRWQGHSDIPLNDQGLAQARALAGRLAGWPIQHVYASDLSRAAETGRLLAEAAGAELQLDLAWRERNCGQFEGKTMAEIERDFPKLFAKMGAGWIEPPGAEPFETVRRRLVAGMETLLEAHAGETVAVVSHGGAISTLVCHVLGIPRQTRARFWLGGNTGLSIVEDGPRGLRLTLLNDTAHLAAAGLDHALPHG